MDKYINLQLGWPSPYLFPSSQLLKGASLVLQSPDKIASSLIYGPDEGYMPLRNEIARWLTATYRPSPSTPIGADRICITNGASGSLHNILAKFTEPGYTRRIWMVEPSYFLACPIYTDAGFTGRIRGVPEDEEGLDISFLRRAIMQVEAEGGHPDKPMTKTVGNRYPKLFRHVIYAVPTFANPSGKTMTLHRREDLVRLAREVDALVITDDVYDVLRWPVDATADLGSMEPMPPRIVDVDHALDGGPKDEWGNAVSNGSFSKIVAPGVRTGWAEGTPALTLALSTVGATRSGGCPSHVTASFIAEMLSSGGLERHILDVLIPTYRARSTALLSELQIQLVPLGFKIPAMTTSTAGGFFIYIHIPSDLGVSASTFAALALEKKNLRFAHGGMMVVEGDEGSVERARKGYGDGIRLCWAWHTEVEIHEGISRMAALVKEMAHQ